MANYCVLQATAEQVAKMQEYYQKKLTLPPPAHAVFSAKNNGVTITAYTSGKVMFQGKTAEAEASRWKKSATVVTNKRAPKQKISKNSSSLPQGFASWSVIGSDEVGNGSYFGPLIVCAAYVRKEQIQELTAAGVKDSKELTDHKIRELAQRIKPKIPYKLLTVTPQKYNEIQPQYNANHMKAVLHNQAIALLLDQISPEKPEGILIDQFTPENTYRRYLRTEKKQVQEKIYFITKGEQYHLAVAAASILCRAAFLSELEKEGAEVGFKLPSGAGSQVDMVAADILAVGGKELLRKCAKLHFANTQKALNRLQRK